MTCWMLFVQLHCMLALTVPAAADEPAAAPHVVATIDGQPIDAAEVERELARVLGDRPVQPEARAALRRETLRQLIDRRLVLQYLDRTGDAATQAEVDRAVQRLEKLAEQQQVAWRDFLDRRGLDEPYLRAQLAWDIGWTRLLEKHATDENLQRYFDQHRREFDGTQVRVAHILLRVESPGDAASVDAAIERAGEIRRQITGGQLTFAAAAQQFSQAPTAAAGGEIGLIGRRGPMPEAFSAAAFALVSGQVSEPLVSPFGVHLIQCLDVVPGDKTWQDVRDDLQQAVRRYLFRWAANQQRPRAAIEIRE